MDKVKSYRWKLRKWFNRNLRKGSIRCDNCYAPIAPDPSQSRMSRKYSKCAPCYEGRYFRWF